MEDIKLNKKKVNPETRDSEYLISGGVVVSSSNQNEAEKITNSKFDKFFNQKNFRKKENKDIYNNTNKKEKRVKSGYIIGFLLIIILGGVYWISNVFEKTNVTIIVKRQTFNLENKKIQINKDEITPINFEIMITSDKKIIKKTLTEVNDVSVKAKGEVTLYNTYSTAPQKIIEGTFLADDVGKTYKTDKSISIPGYKIDKDKKVLPGQIDVDISAFLPGDTYNGTPNNFYITAFKGADKYKKIYGKLKSEIIGGASGIVYTLNDKEKADLDNIANTSFRNQLLNNVDSQVYPGYIVYPNASTFTYSIKEDDLFKDQNAQIEIDGTLSVILLNENDLSEYLIRNFLPKISDQEFSQIIASNLKDLAFNFSENDQLITKDIKSISFNLNGNLNLVWNPGIDKLETELAGMSKKEVNPIFKSDPAIAEANIKIFPPWKSNLSSEQSRIKIITI